jgi:hypothetical protein
LRIGRILYFSIILFRTQQVFAYKCYNKLYKFGVNEMTGLSKDFLWGGATAANQAEGGALEGGRKLANIDMLPTGPDRKKIAAGDMEMLEWKEDYYYPAKEAIDMLSYVFIVV